jgi:ABC-2 type transport system ATP-binding protein
MVDPVDGAENTFYVSSKPEQSSKRPVFKLCVENDWVLTELTPIETKLEDIFRELTKN